MLARDCLIVLAAAAAVASAGPVVSGCHELAGCPASAAGTLPVSPPANYHRLGRQELLRNSSRRRVYEEVCARSGSTPGELANAVGLHVNTVQYHLSRLAKHGWICFRETPRGPLFFENRGVLNPEEERRVVHARAGLQNLAVLKIVEQEPGLRQADVAQALGLARSTMHRRVGRLRDEGFLRDESGLWLTDRGKRALEEAQRVSPAPPVGSADAVPSLTA